jgi:hypothetical protein
MTTTSTNRVFNGRYVAPGRGTPPAPTARVVGVSVGPVTVSRSGQAQAQTRGQTGGARIVGASVGPITVSTRQNTTAQARTPSRVVPQRATPVTTSRQPATRTAAPARTQVTRTATVAPEPSRPGLPSSMRGYAIAQIGRVDAGTVDARATANGFVKSGSAYVHPDGSWLRVASGSVAVGWKGYGLSDMTQLYQNGTGWR